MEFRSEEKNMRETYVDLLIDAAAKDERIVVLDADLAKAIGTPRFAEEYPERHIDCGVAEANMISCAAGMSAMGKIPFTHTFTPFATRRVADQVTLSVSYAGLNVKMVGSDPGVTAELNGGTHMSMEDMAIMRAIPGMTIIEPVDGTQLKALFPQIVDFYGPVYIRMIRKDKTKVFDDGTKFELGKGKLVEEGRDVTIIASGIMVAEALKAREMLEAEGISAEIVNLHTWKPLDVDIIVESAKKTGAVVTAENGSVIGGLGGAVAEALSENCPTPIVRVGVKDCFGEVGKLDYLMEKFNLRDVDIVKAAKEAVAKKEK